MSEYNEPERLDVYKAAESLSEIWAAEAGKKHWYKWCAVAVAEGQKCSYGIKTKSIIYLYLDCKKLPDPFEYYGWQVTPIKTEQPKPVKKSRKK